MGCAKFFIDNFFPFLSISYCSYLHLLLVFYFGKSTLVKLCLVKNNAELGHSRAQDKCQDCCENNICQLAYVLCSAVLCCTLLYSAVLCCALLYSPMGILSTRREQRLCISQRGNFPRYEMMM